VAAGLEKDKCNVSVWGLRRWGKPKILENMEDFGIGGETTEQEQNVRLPSGSTQAAHWPLSDTQVDKSVSGPIYTSTGNSLNTRTWWTWSCSF